MTWVTSLIMIQVTTTRISRPENKKKTKRKAKSHTAKSPTAKRQKPSEVQHRHHHLHDPDATQPSPPAELNVEEIDGFDNNNQQEEPHHLHNEVIMLNRSDIQEDDPMPLPDEDHPSSSQLCQIDGGCSDSESFHDSNPNVSAKTHSGNSFLSVLDREDVEQDERPQAVEENLSEKIGQSFYEMNMFARPPPTSPSHEQFFP